MEKTQGQVTSSYPKPIQSATKYINKYIYIYKYIFIYEDWNFNSGNYLFTTDTK